MIYHAFTKEGYFVAGDSVTGVTSIAYPTSEYAEEAKKNADATAIEMIACEMLSLHHSEMGQRYDLRNWTQLLNSECGKELKALGLGWIGRVN